MDFTPLYQLRERLKAGAVAGCGLIGEDFRLKRAMEAMAPLEGASPVFAKIGDGVRAVFAAPAGERWMALLDALALCDAVLTAQSTVAADGPLEPMPALGYTSTVREIPYSILHPLQEALQSSGGGRYALIMEARQENPRLFEDYRIQHAMVNALGASYSELAERVEDWLSEAGSGIVPLLKEGFDPKGKKEMVRRVRLLDRIAAGAENDFYLSMLDEAEKDVKKALVYALRHEEKRPAEADTGNHAEENASSASEQSSAEADMGIKNVELLIHMAKTEKSGVKKQAHWALAQMDSPSAVAYLSQQMKKNPGNTVEYFLFSKNNQAGVMVADCLMGLLDTWEGVTDQMVTEDQGDMMQKLLLSLVGKSGKEVCAFYKRAAALGEKLDKLGVRQGHQLMYTHSPITYRNGSFTFSQMIPEILTYALWYEPARDLMETARELYRAYGSAYGAAAILSDLLTKGSGEAYESVKAIMEPGIRIMGRKKQAQEDKLVLHHVLDGIGGESDGGVNRLRIRAIFYHPGEERHISVDRYPAEPLDIRWYKGLMDRGKEFDDLLINMVQPWNPQVCDLLNPYFYKRANKTVENGRLIQALEKMGWTDFDGFLKQFCEGQKRMYMWEIRSYAQGLPVSNEVKVKELEEVIRKAQGDKIKESQLEALRKYVDELRG